MRPLRPCSFSLALPMSNEENRPTMPNRAGNRRARGFYSPYPAPIDMQSPTTRDLVGDDLLFTTNPLANEEMVNFVTENQVINDLIANTYDELLPYFDLQSYAAGMSVDELETYSLEEETDDESETDEILISHPLVVVRTVSNEIHPVLENQNPNTGMWYRAPSYRAAVRGRNVNVVLLSSRTMTTSSLQPPQPPIAMRRGPSVSGEYILAVITAIGLAVAAAAASGGQLPPSVPGTSGSSGGSSGNLAPFLGVLFKIAGDLIKELMKLFWDWLSGVSFSNWLGCMIIFIILAVTKVVAPKFFEWLMGKLRKIFEWLLQIMKKFIIGMFMAWSLILIARNQNLFPALYRSFSSPFAEFNSSSMPMPSLEDVGASGIDVLTQSRPLTQQECLIALLVVFFLYQTIARKHSC